MNITKEFDLTYLRLRRLIGCDKHVWNKIFMMAVPDPPKINVCFDYGLVVWKRGQVNVWVSVNGIKKDELDLCDGGWWRYWICVNLVECARSRSYDIFQVCPQCMHTNMVSHTYQNTRVCDTCYEWLEEHDDVVSKRRRI